MKNIGYFNGCECKECLEFWIERVMYMRKIIPFVIIMMILILSSVGYTPPNNKGVTLQLSGSYTAPSNKNTILMLDEGTVSPPNVTITKTAVPLILNINAEDD